MASRSGRTLVDRKHARLSALCLQGAGEKSWLIAKFPHV